MKTQPDRVYKYIVVIEVMTGWQGSIGISKSGNGNNNSDYNSGK